MSSEKSEPEVVGREPCPFCKADCEVRRVKNKPAKLYIMCDGTQDERSCGTRMFLGKRPSRKRLKAAAEAERQPPAEPDPQPEPEVAEAGPTELIERDQGLHYRVIMRGSDRITPVPTHLLGMDASRRFDRDQHRFSRFQPSRLPPPMRGSAPAPFLSIASRYSEFRQ